MKNILESLNEKIESRLNESVKLIADLDDYTPWSGAKDTWNTIIDAGMKDVFDQYLEDTYPDGLTMTELNDMLWFDGEEVLRDLGLAEYPKDVEVEVTNIKFAEDVDQDYVDESTTVGITIENEYDDVKDLVRDALYDDFYRLSPGDIIDFEYEINESCKSKKGKKSLKEEVSDEAYIVADMIMADHKGKKLITWDEFNDSYWKATEDVFGEARELGDDFETDVRAILGYEGYATVFEGENEGGLELVESKTRDDIDAESDDKKEKAKKILRRKEDDADSIRDERKKSAKKAFRKTQDDADADRDYHLRKKGLKESTESEIERLQKLVDYDMSGPKHKISLRTNGMIRKAGLQLVKDKYGDYEVIAGDYER